MDRDEMAQRLKRRREEKRMTVRDLARRVGVSPAYISIIENGQKVPTEELAGRLAHALDEPIRLYHAWARATRESTVIGASRAIREYETQLRTPDLDVQVVTPDDIQVDLIPEEDEMPVESRAPARSSGINQWSLFMRPTSDRDEGRVQLTKAPGAVADLMQGMDGSKEERTQRGRAQLLKSWDRDRPKDEYRIPLFPEGCHPSDPHCEMSGLVRVRKHTVPSREQESLKDPFAYRVSEEGIWRVQDILHPRDLVVITSNLRSRDPNDIYAVRLGGRITLSRILRKGSVVLLLSSQGHEDIEVLAGPDAEKDIVGRVAIVIRTWHYGVFSPSDRRRTL